MMLVRVVAVVFLLTFGQTDASILCPWTKVLSNGDVHYSFLRTEDTGHSSHRLFHSIWTSSRTLRSCSFSDNQAIIQKYFTLCSEGQRGFSQPDIPTSTVFDVKDLCTSIDSLQIPSLEDLSVRRPVRSVDVGSRVKTKLRVKRGFIVPGTLWCGSGNKAPSYSDLGVFSKTDQCCREHDQCQDTILSFHLKYGVFNSNIFTMSHCDCDNRFYNCLKDAQNKISDVVGYTFFNLLKMHCFELSYRLQCTERNWFGMCKESKMALYAEVRPPTLYFTDTEDVNTTTAATSSTQSTSISPTSMNTPVIPTSALPSRNPTQSLPLVDADITEKWCSAYKHLDECRNRILPLQRKYDFSNNEPRTMYHCNCTERFFQSWTTSTALIEAQTPLLDHVSEACFLLQNCTADQICKVELVRAQQSKVQPFSNALVKEQRHLQVMRLIAGRTTSNKSVRLHKLCLRMLRRKVHRGERHHIKETVKKKPE